MQQLMPADQTSTVLDMTGIDTPHAILGRQAPTLLLSSVGVIQA